MFKGVMRNLKLKNKDKRNIAAALSFVTQLGINICVIVGICLFIGHQLDKLLSTSPVFLLIFCVLSIFASFRNIYVLSMAFIDKTENKKKNNFKNK